MVGVAVMFASISSSEVPGIELDTCMTKWPSRKSGIKVAVRNGRMAIDAAKTMTTKPDPFRGQDLGTLPARRLERMFGKPAEAWTADDLVALVRDLGPLVWQAQERSAPTRELERAAAELTARLHDHEAREMRLLQAAA